jgi:hypothetical protein
MSTCPRDKLASCREGVYILKGDGGLVLLHPHEYGDWGLEDIKESFGFGRLEVPDEAITQLALTRDELQQLETLINARGPDFDREFVELCLAVCGQRGTSPCVTFFSNF